MRNNTVAEDVAIIKRLNFVALAGVIFIGGVFWLSVKRTTDDIIATRTEARLAECRRDNIQADRAIAYARAQAVVLVNAAKAAGRGSSTAANDAYIADAEAAAGRLFPQRSCSPQAIEDYYKARGK